MASRSLNKVQLIGNLTRDPELRYTPAGTAVCSLGLATNRSWTTQTGELKEDTEFHRIVAWNKLAELCAQLLAKGRKVYVEGRLSTRTWTGADNVKRTTTEIVISEMIILDSRRLTREKEVTEVDIGKKPSDEGEAIPPVKEELEGMKETQKKEGEDTAEASAQVAGQTDDSKKGKKAGSKKKDKEKEKKEEDEENKETNEVKKEKEEEEPEKKEEGSEDISPDDIPF